MWTEGNCWDCTTESSECFSHKIDARCLKKYSGMLIVCIINHFYLPVSGTFLTTMISLLLRLSLLSTLNFAVSKRWNELCLLHCALSLALKINCNRRVHWKIERPKCKTVVFVRMAKPHQFQMIVSDVKMFFTYRTCSLAVWRSKVNSPSHEPDYLYCINFHKI